MKFTSQPNLTKINSKPLVDKTSPHKMIFNKDLGQSQYAYNQLLDKNKMGPVRKQTNPRRNFCCS